MAESFEPKCIVVTGGCGFVDSNFVSHVVRDRPATTAATPSTAPS